MIKLDVAELKKRWQVRSALAITFESGRIAVELVRRETADLEVVKTFELPVRAEEVVAEPEKTGAKLLARLAAEGIRERNCVACIPANWALTTSADQPDVSEEDLRGYLELRAEREFPIAPADLRLAHSTFTSPAGRPSVTLAAVPAKRFEAIERTLAAAGCRTQSISLGLQTFLETDRAAAALHFLANGNHVDLIVAAGGGIAALRSLSGTAGPDAPPFDAAGFAREVRITLGRLPEGLRQQLRQASFGGAPVSAANLCGAIRNDLQRLGIESRLEESERDHAEAHPGAARAAAARVLRGEPVVFEFLPPKVNRWQVLFQRFDNRRRRWLVLAGALLIVLPILLFFIRSRMESSLSSEWSGMKGKVADLESLQQRIRMFRPWFTSAPQSVQTLEAIAAAFPEEGEVWAKTLQINDAGKVTCTGFARNQTALKGLLDRLRKRPDVTGLQVQQVRGENPVQFSFTYKHGAHDGN